VAATAVAAITTAKVVFHRENEQAIFIVEISRQISVFIRRSAVKLHDAITANAGLVSQIRWHFRNQVIRNFHFGAPARAFVSGNRAKLAIVGLAAQRTLPSVERFVMRRRIHFEI
jgi:hypothetical protein